MTTQVFKIINALDKVSFDFVSRVENRTRGHSRMLGLPKARSAIRDRFFALRVVRVWNSLPDSVVSAPSLKSFKYRLSEVDLSHHLRYCLD